MLGFVADVTRGRRSAATTRPSTWELKLRPFAEMLRPQRWRRPSEANRSGAASPKPLRRHHRNQTPRAPAPATTPRRAAPRAVCGDEPRRRASGRSSRRALDQRQRQQRRRVAVRAAGGVRQQPARRALALQRRPRRPARQLRAGRAAVLVHRPADRRSRRTATCRSSARSAGRCGSRGCCGTAPNVFLGYQRTSDHNASTQSALMPTLLERAGDFSQTRDALGQPIQLVDPRPAGRSPAT